MEALKRPSLHRLVEQVRSMVTGIARKGYRVFLEWKWRECLGIVRADGLARSAKWEGETGGWEGIKLWKRKRIKLAINEWGKTAGTPPPKGGGCTSCARKWGWTDVRCHLEAASS